MKRFNNFVFFVLIFFAISCFVPKDDIVYVSETSTSKVYNRTISLEDSIASSKFAFQYINKSLVFINFMDAFSMIDPVLRTPSLANDFFSRQLYLKANPSIGVIATKTAANIFPIGVWPDSIQYKVVFEGIDVQFIEEFKKQYLKRNKATETEYTDYISTFILTPESKIIPTVVDSMSLTVVKRNCSFFIRPYENAFIKNPG